MAKIKLEDSGEKIFKLAGKTFLKGQYVVEYTETNTDSNGVLTSPEKATVFLRPIAFSQIDRQSSLPFKSPIAWTEFLDSNGDAYADFDTFSEALATAIANFNSGGATPQYKVYSALLTQTGTNDPTVQILENTIGGIVWTRTTTGNYNGTLAGQFLSAKTFVMLASIQNTTVAFAKRLDDNIINVNANNADNRLNNTSIEIRVYN